MASLTQDFIYLCAYLRQKQDLKVNLLGSEEYDSVKRKP